jgi:two-component system, NarL family, invasion response regulator UvrY
MRCECGSPHCRETVALSPATRDALRLTNRPILAPGHRPDRFHETRRSAAAAGEEARAVRSQGVQQLRRSRRNIAAARVEVRARVLVVDDSDAFRRAAASLVSAAPGLRLVGVAESGEEAIRLLPELKPDLVLLDVHMPGLGGLETARVIQSRRPEAVVVLVSADSGGIAADPRSLGAAAFLPKAELRPQKLAELWLKHAPGA